MVSKLRLSALFILIKYYIQKAIIVAGAGFELPFIFSPPFYPEQTAGIIPVIWNKKTSWSPAVGNYTLSITTYSGGISNATTTVNFKVVNNATDGTGTPIASIVINDNAASTTSTQAMLSIKSVNATHMRFYDNSNSNWTSWEPAATTRPWTLSSGAGSKWVKVQVKNVAGKMSATASDGIILKAL